MSGTPPATRLEAAPATPDLRRSLRALRSVMRLQRWGLPAMVVIGFAASLAEGIGLGLFVPLLDSIEGTTDQSSGWSGALTAPFENLDPDQRLPAIGACIFVAIVLRALLGYASSIVFSRFDATVGHRLRSGIFGQLLDVDYRFVERSNFGDLLNTLATETWRTSAALAGVAMLIVSAANVVVYVALLLLLSVPLTLVVGGAMLVIAAITRQLTKPVDALGAEATAANARLSERMVEGLSLNPVIRSFGRERDEHASFDRASRRVSDVSLRLDVLAGAIDPVHQILSGGLLVGVAVVTLRDPSNLSSLLVFMFVLYRLQPQVTRLQASFVDVRSLLAAVEDVAGLLDRSDKPYMSVGSVRHDRLDQGITLDGVTFHYDDDEAPALRNVSVEIPAGKVTALVGPSGSGKSTLVKLLFRFYDPSSGTVLVDGRPLPELDLASWRRSLALVSQDVQLFNASVADNIRYGRADATLDDVHDAARQADAHEFIQQLPDGYDTMLGDLGMRLSGGQQQRVTLARAIIRDPEVLILDEATNALDSRSERIIQDALDALSADRTVIVIAHRFSTIERADHVVVLDEGRVSESGDRATLLAAGGLFRDLAEIQGVWGEGT